MRNGAEVHLLGFRRIAAGAFEQDELLRAGGTRGLHRLLDLRECRHAGGHDERAARARHAADEREIHEFKRRDLPRGHIHLFQELDGGFIERRGEKTEAQTARDGLQPGLPVPRGGGFAVEVVQHAALPCRAGADAEILPVAVEGDGVGGVGLEFDRIRARRVRRPHDGHRLLEVLAVVRGQLRDDVSGMARTDWPPGDFDQRTHGWGWGKTNTRTPCGPGADSSRKPAARNARVEAAFSALIKARTDRTGG